MKLAVRICLYLFLLILAAIFFSRFRRAYNQGNELTRDLTGTTIAATEPAGVPTNQVTGETNLINTNAVAAPAIADASITNGPPASAASRRAGSFIYLGAFVLSLLGLGGLAASEISRSLGNRAGRSVMAEGWVDRRDPEYDEAEEEWAKGNHLDAIGLMREYLKKNPNEQHVALRIAEIYEKDLGNFLAAALEIEEVLTKKLPREKWGWTAIRLSNLYSGRLNQTGKAMALLERIVKDYGETGAAKKARQRLGIPEPEPEPAPPTELASESAESVAAASPPPVEEPPASNLPKGFRPKK